MEASLDPTGEATLLARTEALMEANRLAVRSNIQTLSFSTPLGSGNHAPLRTASMWRGKLGGFPFALP